jgi:hypothetical protein
MPGIFALRQIIPTRTTSSSSGQQALQASLDGALHAMPWKQARVFAGEAYHVSVGAVTTPITGGGAGTVYDTDQPEFVVSVPSGRAIMPIRIHIQMQQPLLATDADESEALIAVDRLSAGSAGTSTLEVAFNMRTDNPAASGCTVWSAYTGNMTAEPTLGIELARSVTVGDVQSAVGVAITKHELLYEPETSPLIVGPASLIGYWGGTVATPGFAEIQWVEFATPPTS